MFRFADDIGRLVVLIRRSVQVWIANDPESFYFAVAVAVLLGSAMAAGYFGGWLARRQGPTPDSEDGQPE